MPIFRYRALTETGTKVSGVIDADSFELAKERLRREKVLVTKLSLLENKKEISLNSSMLLAFTRELSQLLGSGLPLYESLLTIEEKYRRHRTHPLFLDLCDKLKSGHQLSTILKGYPKSFDAIYITLAEAGERTGALAWSFKQLYELTERRQRLKKKLISAMAYPAFLGAFCFLIVIGLLRLHHPLNERALRGTGPSPPHPDRPRHEPRAAKILPASYLTAGRPCSELDLFFQTAPRAHPLSAGSSENSADENHP